MTEPDRVDPWIEVGRIAGAFGVHGAVKVETFVEPAASVLAKTKRWRLQGRSGEPREIDVASIKVQFDSLIAVFAFPQTREEAMLLKGEVISARRSAFPAPGKGEFYWADLVGCEVHNREGVSLGRVDSVDDHGADPLLNVAGRFLIPFIDAYVLEVALERRSIQVDWSEDWS